MKFFVVFSLILLVSVALVFGNEDNNKVDESSASIDEYTYSEEDSEDEGKQMKSLLRVIKPSGN
jgi:hypothetical protein